MSRWPRSIDLRNFVSPGDAVAWTHGGAEPTCLVDFVRGAACSPGGRSIIALPSVTSNGRSRIVSQLECGTVTTPRSEVDLVVTEHGVAELQGRTLSERAAALIAIAHPDHRHALARAFE